MSKLKQFFCTHYHEVDGNGRPLYDLYPKKRIWPLGLMSPISAERSLDAHTCLNCGAKYFDTDNHDQLLSSRMDGLR
jgi:hypothetical protein